MKSKTAEEIAKEILYFPVTNGQAASSVKKGAELIELYAGQSRWISVETPPEKNGNYLVLYTDGSIDVNRWEVHFKAFIIENLFITHWQPLPTPPTP